MLERLSKFLKEELLVSSESIALAKKQSSQDYLFIPIVLLQHGLISLEELGLIWDWIEVEEVFNCH